MLGPVREELRATLAEIEAAGLYKRERIIVSDQKAEIALDTGAEVLNFCANNYLGLANNPEIIRAAQEGMARYGFGMASVRFICGTQNIHRELEEKLAEFFGTEATILYTSCFDANAGLFEVLLDEDDAVVSDELNHASIIDGIRLCKARRYRYANNDMEDLRAKLEQARADGARRIMIATDAVFSMDGIVAQLDKICDLADEYGAMTMCDDAHASGFFGPTGRGATEYCGVMGRVDVVTSTLGKAMGGGSGGFTTGRAEIVELLRQRSRPYLFSNTLTPGIVCAALKTLEILSESTELRDRLAENTRYFRARMTEAGFDIIPGVHPIVPIMLGDAKLSQQMADRLLEEGIYVVGFFYPVVPRNKARIRVQVSAAHEREHLDRAVEAFTRVGRELGVIG